GVAAVRVLRECNADNLSRVGDMARRSLPPEKAGPAPRVRAEAGRDDEETALGILPSAGQDSLTASLVR
ncbi:MAG: hypothetical protein ABIW49_00760, partial [Knoellia sp.]